MSNPIQSGAVAGGPRLILRLEGALIAVGAIAAYGQTGSNWWLFAGLFLVPDLSMLGYVFGPRLGALVYNCGHSLIAPALLMIGSWLADAAIGLPIALVWFAHIGADRALGYGLKYSDGFAFTHLGVAKLPGASSAR